MPLLAFQFLLELHALSFQFAIFVDSRNDLVAREQLIEAHQRRVRIQRIDVVRGSHTAALKKCIADIAAIEASEVNAQDLVWIVAVEAL